MGDTARALGHGPEIEFEGKVYEVTPLTYELQAKFETWLERRAFEAVRRSRVGVSDDEYYRLLAAVAKDVAAGEYAFGGKTSIKAGECIPGIRQLLLLSLSRHHPEVDLEFVDRLIVERLVDAVRALTQANSDPKAVMSL